MRILLKGEFILEPKTTFTSIDEYISQFPPEVQEKLQLIRKVIKESAPDAIEKISYQMPAFAMHGILVYFAAFKKHISFFPTASGVAAFVEELSEYKGGKGTIQFPHDKPIPYELISRIVKYRVAENISKAETKPNKKK
jgi:uncharacterized protein YdhG (YjbR/CyaY superfamily)